MMMMMMILCTLVPSLYAGICRCPVTSTMHPWRCMRPHWWPACQNLSGRLSRGEAMGVIMKKLNLLFLSKTAHTAKVHFYSHYFSFLSHFCFWTLKQGPIGPNRICGDAVLMHLHCVAAHGLPRRNANVVLQSWSRLEHHIRDVFSCSIGCCRCVNDKKVNWQRTRLPLQIPLALVVTSTVPPRAEPAVLQ